MKIGRDLKRNMEKNCNNCIHHNTCKDRITLDNTIRYFEENSNANSVTDELFFATPSEDRICIEYEMWCKNWYRGLEDNEEK